MKCHGIEMTTEEVIMEVIADVFNNMGDDDRANWSLEEAKAVVRDQIELDKERGIAPLPYNPTVFYDIIRALIEQDEGECEDDAKNSFEILTACERMSAHTIEVAERPAMYKQPLTGVANSTPNGTVRCFVGNDDGEDDCEISPEEFNRRFEITAAIFT